MTMIKKISTNRRCSEGCVGNDGNCGGQKVLQNFADIPRPLPRKMVSPASLAGTTPPRMYWRVAKRSDKIRSLRLGAHRYSPAKHST